MSIFKDDVDNLVLVGKNSTILQWVTLLNFFNNHKNELDISELNMLHHQCEVYRHTWNAQHQDIVDLNDVSPNIQTFTKELQVKLFGKSE